MVLLHGSKQTGESLRKATGYAFDKLADQHGFVTVYPDAYERRWNDCRGIQRELAHVAKLGLRGGRQAGAQARAPCSSGCALGSVRSMSLNSAR